MKTPQTVEQLARSIIGLNRAAARATNPALQSVYLRNRNRCAARLLTLDPSFLLNTPANPVARRARRVRGWITAGVATLTMASTAVAAA